MIRSALRPSSNINSTAISRSQRLICLCSDSQPFPDRATQHTHEHTRTQRDYACDSESRMSGEGGKVRYKREKKGRAFSINPPSPTFINRGEGFSSFPLLLGESVTWCFLLFNVKILSSFSRRRDWKESLFFIFFFFVKNFTLHKRGKGNRDIGKFLSLLPG